MSNDSKIEVGSQPLKEIRRENFCLLYVENPFNPQDLYRQSGFRPNSKEACRVATSRLLHDVTVIQRIAWLRKERNKRLGRSAEDVIDGLWKIRDRCLTENNVLRDRQGNPIEVSVEIWGKDGKSKIVKRCIVWQFDRASGLKASEMLAKHFGILTDSLNINDGDKIKQQINDEAQDIVTNLLLNKEHGVQQDKDEVEDRVDKGYPTLPDPKARGEVSHILSTNDDGDLIEVKA